MEIQFTQEKEYLISGEIIVIDPQYIFSEENWKNIEDYVLDVQKIKSGIMNVNNTEFYIFSTLWGDGVYPVKYEGELIDEINVDSGYIGIFKKEEFEKITKDYDLGTLIHLHEKGLITCNTKGILKGLISVDTSNMNDDEENQDEGDEYWSEM